MPARVRSAGLLRAGIPADQMGQDLVHTRGLDLSGHRSRTVSRDILLGADLVVGLARQHVREAVVTAPEAWPRTFTLKELVRRGEAFGARYANEPFPAWLSRVSEDRTTADMMGASPVDDVSDPIGQPEAAFESMIVEIDGLLERLVELAWAHDVPAAPEPGAVVQAETAGSQAAEPVPPIEPQPVEPQPVEPQPVEPQPVEPQPVEPQPVEPVPPVDPEPVEPVPPVVPRPVVREAATQAAPGTGAGLMGTLGGGRSATGAPTPPARAVVVPPPPPAADLEWAPPATEPEPAQPTEPAGPPPEPVMSEPIVSEPAPAPVDEVRPPAADAPEVAATPEAVQPDAAAPEAAAAQMTERPTSESVDETPTEPPPDPAPNAPEVADVEVLVAPLGEVGAGVTPPPETEAPAAPPANAEVLVGASAEAEVGTRVAIGSDHAGLDLKAHLVDHLRQRGHLVHDLGTHTADSVDYPDYGVRVARAVAAGDAQVGVCVCGTGIGIAANKVAGIRAAIVHDVTSAEMARRHNDANVICVGARLLGPQVASDTVDAFLAAGFEGGRHQRRIDEISALDHGDEASSAAAGASDEATVFDDTEVFDVVAREVERQNTTLQLIASENFTSPAVMAAQGSVLTNKYSEGYPGKRYYGGNAVVDVAENLARDRVKALFGAEHANVQPHSGANANMAVYLGLLEPGDTVLGMRLDQGGHLTHGSPVNFSGRLYHFVSYGVTESDERLDYDQIRDLARQERPKAIIAGATAYPRIIDPEILRMICDEVGALLIFDAAHIAGLIAGGVHPNPVPFADVVTFTTHKTLRGPRSGCILSTEAHAKAIDKAVFPGLQGGPLMHVIAAKAVAFREASQPSFRAYAAQIVANAQALARALAEQGFRLVSGGTDNHLMLVDLRPFDADLTGKEAQETLDRAGITLNKNQIPGDPRSPFVTSGLRIGTAAVTTAGMGEAEMAEVALLIGHALRRRGESGALDEVRDAVATLCSKFTPYPHLIGRR